MTNSILTRAFVLKMWDGSINGSFIALKKNYYYLTFFQKKTYAFET